MSEQFDDQFHREFGRHSGIPDCCIEHWLVWRYQPKSPEECARITKRTEAQIWHHSPCPACEAAGKVAKIHICGDRCVERDEITWRARQRNLAARRAELRQHRIGIVTRAIERGQAQQRENIKSRNGDIV